MYNVSGGQNGEGGNIISDTSTYGAGAGMYSDGKFYCYNTNKTECKPQGSSFLNGGLGGKVDINYTYYKD